LIPSRLQVAISPSRTAMRRPPSALPANKHAYRSLATNCNSRSVAELAIATSSLERPGQVDLNTKAEVTRGRDDPEQDGSAVPTLHADFEDRVEAQERMVFGSPLAAVVVDGDVGIVDEQRKTLPWLKQSRTTLQPGSVGRRSSCRVSQW
jgi:hypothetical protein